jgi:YcaO-like protein with predicted kinase domain
MAEYRPMSATHPGHQRLRSHRVVSPVETVARMKPFLPALGITRVANVTGLDVVGIPTFMVARPNGRSLSVHQGKGPDPDAARASGIMEAAEHHIAEHATEPSRLSIVPATAEELRRCARVIDVSRLPGSVRPFHPNARTLWVRGEDIASGELVWVPYELVHVDLRLPLPPGSGFFPLGSNGLASGNDPLEASIHAICELIERDAMTLFYRESATAQAQRRIDPATIDDELGRALLERFERAGVEVAVWDVTTDVRVPSIFCMTVDREFDPFRPIGAATGSGTHPHRAMALCRALCEAAQSRLTRIVGARDDLQGEHLSRHRAPEATLAALQQMRSSEPVRPFDAVPSASTSKLAEDVRFLLDRLAEGAMGEVVAVDLSRPDVPCFVLRAIVPGLEGVLVNPSYRPGARARAQRRSAP